MMPPEHTSSLNPDPRHRLLIICAISTSIGTAAVGIAWVLTSLIALCTNLAFFGRLSIAEVTPATNTLGVGVIAIPVLGALIVGLMARFGHVAIRGHGIPEAMEQILTNGSRISPRLTILKPASAAIAIGTGGPFGAEGPIIATGGALGSLVGQLLHTTSDERKTLLAAGAAAGMSAIFGTPVAAVLLAIELLLFEYRSRSLIPVALAAAVATGMRGVFQSGAATFAMPTIDQPSGEALTTYIVIGALVGLCAVLITKALFYIEELFESLPIHWMWWPALGAIVVGVVGYFQPLTLGVGYSNIRNILGGDIVGTALIGLVVFKSLSWLIALGSGTSGGTLAPLFTIGGGVGALLGAVAAALFPSFGVDPRIAALVGMAAMFTGASRALLTSVVFAFETTRQPMGLLPLLGGCTSAYLISLLMMRHTIMTEKLAKRGTVVPTEYVAIPVEELVARDSQLQRTRHLRLNRRPRTKV